MENREMRNLSPRKTMFGAALMAGALLAGTAATAAAQAQSRMRVLVPAFVNAEGKSTRDGGRLADQVRKSINQMPTHAPTEDKEWKDALKKFELRESDMDCIKWRQLAAQANIAQLVLCGTLDESTRAVTASFYPTGGGDAFEVPQFAFQAPEQGAQQVVQSFETYVRQLSLVTYCNDYINSQNWQQALDLCTQAIELNPRSVSANYARGSALTNMDRNEEALEAYRKVLEFDPLHQDAMLAAGIIAAKLGRQDVSQQYFQEYLALNPGDDNVRLSIAHDLANAGDPAGALVLVEEAASGAEASVSLLEYTGHFAMNAGLEAQRAGPANGNTDAANVFFTKAIEYYNRAVEMKGDSADATVLRNLMMAYNIVGNQAQALAFGQRATANSEDAQAWLVYSDVLRDAGRTNEAIAALDRAGQLNPELAGIGLRKVTMMMAEGRIDEAVATVKAGRAAGSFQADHAENIAQQIAVRGYNVTQEGRPEAAMRFFTAAREIGKSERTIGMINFFNGYALVRQADGMLREATTAAPARRAMPILERAKVMLDGAGAYSEQAAQRANLLENVRQYMEMARALIDMG
jgi:tetratricopeptide (TPR) repeat protein